MPANPRPAPPPMARGASWFVALAAFTLIAVSAGELFLSPPAVGLDRGQAPPSGGHRTGTVASRHAERVQPSGHHGHRRAVGGPSGMVALHARRQAAGGSQRNHRRPGPADDDRAGRHGPFHAVARAGAAFGRRRRGCKSVERHSAAAHSAGALSHAAVARPSQLSGGRNGLLSAR